jgi:DNA-binding LacI/PurR family transcriptional regulator
MTGIARRVTSADVAERAGVSRKVVSMVLNNRTKGQVSAATRERIEEIAKEMQYTRSAVAMSLKRQTTHTIGLVTDEIASRSSAGLLIRGATEAALERGYMLLTLDVGHSGVDLEGSVAMLQERRVDGVLFATASRSTLDLKSDSTLPLVMVNSSPTQAADVPTFLPDDRGGAALAIRRLVDAGHRRIAMLTGDEGNTAEREREAGATEQALRHGVELEIVQAGWFFDGGYRAATAALSRADRPTGLFCIRDRVAAGAIQAAVALGLEVPADVSIVGFDDEVGFADVLVPPLTTVSLPLARMGRLAMMELLDRLAVEGKRPHQRAEPIVLPCALVERKSIDAPRQ